MSDFKLFVRNMAPEVTDDLLQSTFAQFGEVSFCRICVDQDTQQSRGFGFVCFTTQEAANMAVEQLNGTELEGKAIEIKQVESRPAAQSTNPLFQMECYAFKKGQCKFGSQCRFSHQIAPAQENAAAEEVVKQEDTTASFVEEPQPAAAAPKREKKKRNKD